MKSSHAKPRPNLPPPIIIPPHAPVQNYLRPDSATLRVWVEDKLGIVPTMYSKYEEGMKAIKESIHQDFSPQDQNVAMQAFYKEFYAAGAGTGAELWAHWRNKHRKKVSDFHIPSAYSTTGAGNASYSQRQELPIAFDRKITLGLATRVNKIPSTTKEQQLRTSALISEAEGKLLQNRDSNYWGDLATPVWPQSAGKAKVVFIRPKSTRPVLNDQSPYPATDSNYIIGNLSRQESQVIHRSNSLPVLRTSLIGNSKAVGGIAETFDLETSQKPSAIPPNTSKPQQLPTPLQHNDRTSLLLPVAPLKPKRQYDGNSFSSTPSPTVASNGTPESSHSQSPPQTTLGTGAPERVTGIHLDFSREGNPESIYSLPKRSFPNTFVTRSTFGGTTRHSRRANPKRTYSPEAGNTYTSPIKNKSSDFRMDGNGHDTRWHRHDLPVHEVHQGHGTMGLHSPVESFVASPSDPNTTKVRFIQTRDPRAPLGFPEQLLPISVPTQEFLPSIYPTPGSKYSGVLNPPYNNNRIFSKESTLKTFHQSQSKDIYGQAPHHSHRQGLVYQPPGKDLRSLKGPPLRTLDTLPTGKPSLQGISDNTAELAHPAVRVLDGASTHLGGEQKLRARFSFVLPHMHLGSRTAHIPHRRNSFQLPILSVTKEVIQEEESDVGIFNKSTFAAHIPRFGKDPMKEINKVHAKGDTKKSTFFRVIQDAVHDGINITRKTPPKKLCPNIAPLKAALNANGKHVNKMMISEPINPLKVVNSISTPNLLFQARQIPKELATIPPNPHGKSAPITELLPWELDTSMTDEDELLSEDEIDMIQSKPLDTKVWGEGRPAITIDPFEQAILYSWIECSVVQACSDFLKQQQNELNLVLLKKEVKKWRNGEVKFSSGETNQRDQPIEFMFGMEVQCKLVEGNYKALHFSGPSAMNPITIISAWKNIIPSFSPRTFCFPDYLILEHLRVIEKVLNLFGPAYWDSNMFEKKRSETVKRIMDSGQAQKARNAAAKMEKLQKDRETAEAQLLMEVGIWSTN